MIGESIKKILGVGVFVLFFPLYVLWTGLSDIISGIIGDWRWEEKLIRWADTKFGE